MWKKAFELFVQSVSILRQVKESREQLAQLRADLEETNRTLNDLIYKFQLLAQREQSEREKLALQLENALLRFDKEISASVAHRPKRKKR